MHRKPPDAPLDILVAEDDDAGRQGLEKALAVLGHGCRLARDGEEAWELHRARRADVILSDWHMPRLDGVSLCKRLRASEAPPTYTYFILLTAYDDKEHFVRGMEAGADDYHTKPVDLDELRARLVSARRVVALRRTLAQSNADLRRDSQRIFAVARVDPLTQTGSRLRMEEDLRALWDRALRYGHGYCVGIVDVDRFKDFNDARGHLAGDEVLRGVARAAMETLRRGDAVYRYGGDELLVVLPEQSLDLAARALERVRAAVEKLGGPTVSVGVAQWGPADGAPDGAIARADAALYRAKQSGRNRVEADAPVTARAPAETTG